MPVQITNYLASAVVVGLINIGDFLEAADDRRWHTVARAASLIEGLRNGRITVEAFTVESEPISIALREIADEFQHSHPRIDENISYALTVMDGVRLGLAEVSMEPGLFCLPPSMDNPLLEIRHA